MPSEFEEKVVIDAPVSSVWEVLADIGEIHQWNPGVKASHTTSAAAGGLGATRHCDLGGPNFLDEEVVGWDPGRALTMRITGTNMPFKAADIRFFLEAVDDGRTQVTVSPIYRLKYGPLGSLLDTLFVKRTYQKGMGELLEGLKAYIEG